MIRVKRFRVTGGGLTLERRELSPQLESYSGEAGATRWAAKAALIPDGFNETRARTKRVLYL